MDTDVELIDEDLAQEWAEWANNSHRIQPKGRWCAPGVGWELDLRQLLQDIKDPDDDEAHEVFRAFAVFRLTKEFV